MNWMDVEMKSRMRATAPLRSSTQPTRSSSNAATARADTCPKFLAVGMDQCIKVAKESHVCFSFMKTARRDHRADNCRRRRKCMKNMEGDAKNHAP